VTLSLLVALVACRTPPPAELPPEVAAAAAPAPLAAPEPAEAVDRPPRLGDLSLAPDRPRYTDAVEVTASARDPDGDAVALSYAWYVNDAPITESTGPRLTPGRFKKGDRVTVEVTAFSNGKRTTRKSDPVIIANTVPAFQGDPRTVTNLPDHTFFANDPDHDTLAWSLEGAPRGMTITPDGTVRYAGSEDEPGGNYRVAVVASDGEGFARLEIPLRINPGSKAAKAK
jgi:hypothetical protein